LGWEEEQSPSVIESSIVVLNDLLDRKGWYLGGPLYGGGKWDS
jgi:hypothetical protein